MLFPAAGFCVFMICWVATEVLGLINVCSVFLAIKLVGFEKKISETSDSELDCHGFKSDSILI